MKLSDFMDPTNQRTARDQVVASLALRLSTEYPSGGAFERSRRWGLGGGVEKIRRVCNGSGEMTPA